MNMKVYVMYHSEDCLNGYVEDDREGTQGSAKYFMYVIDAYTEICGITETTLTAQQAEVVEDLIQSQEYTLIEQQEDQVIAFFRAYAQYIRPEILTFAKTSNGYVKICVSIQNDIQIITMEPASQGFSRKTYQIKKDSNKMELMSSIPSTLREMTDFYRSIWR